MRVFCIHLVGGAATEAQAIYDTQWQITNGRKVMELLDEMHESVRKNISLEIYCVENMIYLCIAGESDIVDFLVSGLYGVLGDIEIKEIEDYTQLIDKDTAIVATELRLKDSDVLPVLDYRVLSFNSMSPLIPTLSKFPSGDRVLLQIVIKPFPSTTWTHFTLWRARVQELTRHAMHPKTWFKQGLKSSFKDKMIEKCGRKLYWTNYRMVALSQLPADADSRVRAQTTTRLKKHLTEVCNSIKFINTIGENGFRQSRFSEGRRAFDRFQRRVQVAPYRVSTIELATLWHPPGLSVIPNSAQVLSKKAAPPKSLPSDPDDNQISFFGHTNYRNQIVPFGVKRFDRRRHFYVLGKSGSGKSCLLQLLIKNDIEHGYGCAVLDPHGDLVDDLLKLIPKHRVKDVVLFDPSDTAYPPSFNPLSAVRPELKMRATIGFLEVFKRVVGSDWSEKMDHVIRYSMLALLNVPGASMLSLRKILTDDDYREAVVEKLEDEQVRRFWHEEFVNRRGDFEGDVSRILNRLDHLLATDMVRNIVGQPMNLFDFREFMDTRKIVLMKVSKGILGAENAAFLGSLIIAKIYEAAMSRADVTSEQRQDFYFYIDEFQNFATDSFGEILSESRKYKLCLTFANQYLDQLPTVIRQTVFGNVGNFLSFRVGGHDAPILSEELKPRFSAPDTMNLGAREFYVKMSVEGEVQEAFSGRTLELQAPLESQHFAKECIKNSRTKYSLPLETAIESLNVSEYGIYERYSEG